MSISPLAGDGEDVDYSVLVHLRVRHPIHPPFPRFIHLITDLRMLGAFASISETVA